MKTEETPKIPVTETPVQQENCAHSWVKTEIRGRKALKCKYCGKIIDHQD